MAPDPLPDDARPVPRRVPQAPHAWLLITGDPVSGFVFYGPFRTRSAAEDARDEQAMNLRRDAVIARLERP